jgi:hypothetical protein
MGSGAVTHDPSQAMDLSIALRRAFLGVVLLSAFVLGSGAAVQLQPQAASTEDNHTLSSPIEGDSCLYLAGRWWCPGARIWVLLRPLLLP